MKIRPAKTGDAETLAKIHVAGWQTAYTGIIPAYSLKKMSITKSTERFKEAIKSKTEETYIIEEKGVIVGFSTVGKCRDADMKNDTGEIWGIYIDPEEWRKGYGKHLAAYTEKLLEKRGFGKITLWVLADNTAARKFYEHLEFKPEGKIKTLKKHGNAKVIRYIKQSTNITISTIKSAREINILRGKPVFNYTYDKPAVESLKKRLKLKDSLFLIAKKGTSFAGFCCIDRDWREANWFFIREILVDPKFRERGIGKQLMEKCITHARNKRATGIVTETAFKNIPMQKLCESLGFTRWYNPEWKKGITFKLPLTK